MSNFGYRIREGVRRSVAVRESGRHDIAAVVAQDGQPDQLTRLSLDELYSPKPTIDRDIRYIRDTEYPTLVLGLDPPPIAVTPIRSATAAKYLTPIRAVRLV